MKRKEFKFLISETAARSIFSTISPYVIRDPYCLNHPKGAYPVYSLYFDTPAKQFFYDKFDGELERLKIRIRTYSIDLKNPQPIFLEYKRKIGEIIIKDREEISFKDYQKITTGKGHQFFTKHKSLKKNFGVNILSMRLTPTVVVAFKREAFFEKIHARVRINFDRCIRAISAPCLFSSSFGKPVLSHHLIMEIKFTNAIPLWLHQVISNFDLQRTSFSKYFHSLIACSIVDEQNFLKFT